MSAGAFSNTFYETRTGNICKIKIQPETLGLTFGVIANLAPAGPADQLASAKVSAGKTEIGVIARTATIVMPNPPTGYLANSPITLPILQLSTEAAWLLLVGQTGQYLGVDAELVGISPERIR